MNDKTRPPEANVWDWVVWLLCFIVRGTRRLSCEEGVLWERLTGWRGKRGRNEGGRQAGMVRRAFPWFVDNLKRRNSEHKATTHHIET